MELLDDALIFAAGVFSFVGFFAALAFRRERQREIGLFAVLCATLAVSAIARAVSLRTGSALAARVATSAVVPAFALVEHFAIDYGKLRSRRALIGGAYGIAAGVLLLGLTGALEQGGPPVAGALALGAVGIAAVVWVFARAYLHGRREAFPAIVASVILLAAVLNDAGLFLGLLDTTRLTLVGFVALVGALSTLLLARFREVASELERSKKALRARSRELRRSYGELRTTQQELVRKEQLAVVGELAAVIAHEVRNPLAVVSNAVAGLKKAELSPGDQATLLAILDEEVSRLNRLVSDLLGYARPLSLQRTQLALDELIERALVLARARGSVSVRVLREAPDARIWADANHLRQVFDNLIDNAVQAMSGEGTLTVRMRPSTTDGVDGLAVDVVDTGEGMDTMVRMRAKDPFFTTRPSGTGLGLAIVDRIIDAHGGRFLIESRTGEGTTATVFLPFGRASEPPQPSSRAAKREATAPTKDA